MKGESVYRGWLGISVDSRALEQIIINNVASPSPIKAAGVLVGDRLLAINDVPVRHYGAMVRETYMMPAGQVVRLKIGRYDDPDAVDGAPGPQLEMREFEVTIPLARNTELGALPEAEEPFDPSNPFPHP